MRQGIDPACARGIITLQSGSQLRHGMQTLDCGVHVARVAEIDEARRVAQHCRPLLILRQILHKHRTLLRRLRNLIRRADEHEPLPILHPESFPISIVLEQTPLHHDLLAFRVHPRQVVELTFKHVWRLLKVDFHRRKHLLLPFHAHSRHGSLTRERNSIGDNTTGASSTSLNNSFGLRLMLHERRCSVCLFLPLHKLQTLSLSSHSCFALLCRLPCTPTASK